MDSPEGFVVCSNDGPYEFQVWKKHTDLPYHGKIFSVGIAICIIRFVDGSAPIPNGFRRPIGLILTKHAVDLPIERVRVYCKRTVQSR